LDTEHILLATGNVHLVVPSKLNENFMVPLYAMFLFIAVKQPKMTSHVKPTFDV